MGMKFKSRFLQGLVQVFFFIPFLVVRSKFWAADGGALWEIEVLESHKNGKKKKKRVKSVSDGTKTSLLYSVYMSE